MMRRIIYAGHDKACPKLLGSNSESYEQDPIRYFTDNPHF
ncbi:hypothetical protein BZA02_103311 [Ruegeria sp. P4]|jgi:hypothetical protein|nr:hypothetical protein BZA02_103311 [Ruegeria sp. P4]